MASPSTSPPRTPDDPRSLLKKPDPNSPSSDESSIIDLSFDWTFDADGNYVRNSKGSKSSSSSPPTPQDTALADGLPPKKSPSPKLSVSPISRNSLSRSESAYPVLSGTTGSSSIATSLTSERSARSFQRVASGPISSTPSYAVPTVASSLSSSRHRAAPRRVTLEDAREAASRSRPTLDAHQEEKENISESDEVPYALPVIPSKRNSPPLASRSIPSSRLLSARSTYSSGNSSRPLADVHLPQRVREIAPGPNRAGRIMKNPPPNISGSKYATSSAAQSSVYDRIPESELVSEMEESAPILQDDTDIEEEHLAVPHSAGIVRHRSQAAVEGLSRSGNTRPRRSASLSDALARDDYQLQVQQSHQPQLPSSRPGTSLGLNQNNDNTAGARRVTLEERDRQEMELRAEIMKYRQLEPELDEHVESRRQQRQSPSPTHGAPTSSASSRPLYGHRRRDSDTLRSLVPPLETGPLASPTVMDMPGRRGASSPAPLSAGIRSQGRVSPPNPKERVSSSLSGMRSSAQGRVSPPTSKGRLSPPREKGRLSPSAISRANSAASNRDIARHRRSPTAPEPPTTSAMMAPNGSEKERVGKTWAAGDAREDDYEYASEKEREVERERERERDRERRSKYAQQQQPLPPPPQSAPAVPVAQAAPPAPPATQANRQFVVNKKPYARLDLIGKGGSSRVFRVLNSANELYAIKRVSLDKTDSETMNGYMNEIALLKRLEGNSRIIRLIDSEVRAGAGGSKGHLMLVMECGEVDLARLLQEQMTEKVNMVWVAYYWQQMLQAVHVIHEEKIVHSDLKPANFVLVRGQLKLIDFGIANAIANDTTNIQRDHQIGTVNYMSPEAIEVPDGLRRLKVGRPSDVWSLGCILYQMIYGHPPFHHLSMYQKMKAIPDATHVIEFPEYATPSMPASRNSNGTSDEQPRKLDHLTTKVRKDVIASIKSCLVRNPKERATIPELLDQEWLSMKELEPPVVKNALAPNETAINPYYMRQLLEYGIRLGQSQSTLAADSQLLLREAERLVGELRSVQQAQS